MHTYEIEIKSLLGSSEKAADIRDKMLLLDPHTKLTKQNKQLNHYFIGGDMDALYARVAGLFDGAQHKKLEKILNDGREFSIRTRQMNEKLLLVVKASIDDTTSANGISRIEFEEEVQGRSLAELDALLLSAGFSYQAKWSREREEYLCKDVHVCLDKNAGYGYVAEFERMINDAAHAPAAQRDIRLLMEELGVEELPQDRLERMFAHYNKHWPDYYGTDKIFTLA